MEGRGCSAGGKGAAGDEGGAGAIVVDGELSDEAVGAILERGPDSVLQARDTIVIGGGGQERLAPGV